MKKRIWILALMPFLILVTTYLYQSLVYYNLQYTNENSVINITQAIVAIGTGIVCGLILLIITLFEEDGYKFYINGSSLIISIICLIFIIICINSKTAVIQPYGANTFMNISWSFCTLSGVLLTSSFYLGKKGRKLFKINFRQVFVLLLIVIMYYIVRVFMNYLYYSVPRFINNQPNPQFSIFVVTRNLLDHLLIILSGYVVLFDTPVQGFRSISYLRALTIIFAAVSVLLLLGFIVQIPLHVYSIEIPVILNPLADMYRMVFSGYIGIGFAVLILTGLFLRLCIEHNKQISRINKLSEQNIV